MVDPIRNGERGLSVRNKLNQIIAAFNTGALSTGPANNLFGATSGDVNTQPLSVNAAANRTAAETVRDAYFAANPSNLAQYTANPGFHIFLLYTDGSNTEIQPQQRVGGAWVDAISIVAIQGASGMDGLTIQFTSIAARDTFFTANPTRLLNGLPILVHDATSPNNVVIMQVWDGTDSPTSYTAGTDAVFWAPATVRADTSSFELGDVHKITSGGENVYFENQDSDINYFPPWQAVGDHTTVDGRFVQNRPTARTYGDLQMVEFSGPVAATGATDYNVPFTLPANESVHGVEITAAEVYNGVITYRVQRVRSGGNIIVYNHTETINVTDGATLELWFDVPLDGRQGTATIVQLVKPDGTFLSVRPLASDATRPYTEVRLRNFTDDGMAYQSELLSVPRQFTRTNTSFTINGLNVAQFQPRGFIEFTNESGQVDLIIAAGAFTLGDELIIKHFSVSGIPSAAVRIEQQGTGARIDSETDIILAMDSAITLRLVAENVWRVVSAYNLATDVQTEQIQDIVGAMFAHNTGVTYDDTDGQVDLPAPSTGGQLTTEEVQDIVGAMVSGNAESGIVVTYDDTTGKLHFSVAGDGNTMPTPSLHNLAVNIPSRVDVNTNLNVTTTFSYDVTNFAQLTALQLIVTAGNNASVTLPVRDGAQTGSVNLSGIVTSSAGTVTFQLSGTTAVGTVTSNVVTINVRNLQAQELTYVDFQADNNPINFTVEGANSAEYQASQTIAIPTFTGSQYVGIAQPQAEADITSIIIDNIEQVGAFTKANGTFSIGGVAYEFFYSNNRLLGSVVSGANLAITRG